MAPAWQATMPLPVPIRPISGKRALRAAETELLAGRRSARRALEVIAAYESEHADEPLGR
jgi:hypothetical protein